MKNKKLGEIFRLKPLKAAKVSEISEATAGAPIKEQERVNFHIGHPVQDERLSALYFKLATALDPALFSGDTTPSAGQLAEWGWDPVDAGLIGFIYESIRKSAPYMPRGGFTRNKPHPLALFLHGWLTEQQSDPINYDLGSDEGRREMILASGGLAENLRVLLHALSRFLEHLPARVLNFGPPLPDHLKDYAGLDLFDLPENETSALEEIQRSLHKHAQTGHFLILGRLSSEQFRRQCRNLCLEQPLFIIETNNAPNHLSLAREALMAGRVLRFLTPEILGREFAGLSPVFILGNADFLQILEAVHFELKGTPSAPEMDLTHLLATSARLPQEPRSGRPEPDELPAPDPLLQTFAGIAGQAGELVQRLTASARERATRIAARAAALQERSSFFSERRTLPALLKIRPVDDLAGLSPAEVVRMFFSRLTDSGWQELLQDSLLKAFVSHHPEYDVAAGQIVSGSARTALSILGFHCGLQQVIISDLGWTYEHCFPAVETVALKEDLTIDAAALRTRVSRRLAHGDGQCAVVFNNPNNATGSVYKEDELRELLKWLLRQHVFVIDDLSYQNVAPSRRAASVKTLRQLAGDLQRDGYLLAEDERYLITVHSLSKTDSFAGARLAFIECRHEQLAARFRIINSAIRPNHLAILLAYLFYRNHPEDVQSYWQLRNAIFEERLQAMLRAARDLPAERNPYGLRLQAPQGSMYPQLIIEQLPRGLSLDWLSSGLARQGIGLIPLTAFARTAAGFERARQAFRLTLGGAAPAEQVYRQMRRVLIDLNRLIAQEEARYNFKTIPVKNRVAVKTTLFREARTSWQSFLERMQDEAGRLFPADGPRRLPGLEAEPLRAPFAEFLQERSDILNTRFSDRLEMAQHLLSDRSRPAGERLAERFEREFYKDNLETRRQRFKKRLFDRTVHPTQMYSLQVDLAVQEIIGRCLSGAGWTIPQARALAAEVIAEYLGSNVPINSVAEADELILDLNAHIEAESFMDEQAGHSDPTLLSFWGDWDGSTRPSGQGHRLVAAVVIENVSRLARILNLLHQIDPAIETDPSLLAEIDSFRQKKTRYWKLLNEITGLTNQLEKRYRYFLPFETQGGRLRALATRLHLMRDPLTQLWQHNDRLERKMLNLRQRRKQGLQYYFSLNKRLRKELYKNIPHLLEHLDYPALTLEAGSYRDLLKRFVLTPRIHQKLITSSDPFAIDTTVFNITEINEIGAAYGNPGLVLALQVSMSTRADALIVLDRKLRAGRQQALRRQNGDLPHVWSIPLFEDERAIDELPAYLDKLWSFAGQSRRVDQSVQDRFAETICELFFAGSDLSQQISQPAGARLYLQAKHTAIRWLAERDLVKLVRIKLGSGEPMQRQGGYLDTLQLTSSGPWQSPPDDSLSSILDPATRQSTHYAQGPLRGILAGGDLRTWQSALSEKLRLIDRARRAHVLHHVSQMQLYHDQEIARAGEPLVETRLQFREQGLRQLEQLTLGRPDPLYDRFIEKLSANFRHILYGSEEDVFGIHVISYFISRAMPVLRDRPTIRPSRETGNSIGQQVIERVAQVLPLSRHGSLLRAIGHNRAQSLILGINQLSCGLFRSFRELLNEFSNPGEGLQQICNRILPRLPVYEILHSLRLYHDRSLQYIDRCEQLFPAGNSAISVLREDLGNMAAFTGLLQKELLRQHGLSVAEFFNGPTIHVQILPHLRPDLAVLLQPDLLNDDAGAFFSLLPGKVDSKWRGQVGELLGRPRQIARWREKSWQLIGTTISEQVGSFIELARAIHTLTRGQGLDKLPFSASPARIERLGLHIRESLRDLMDDSMRQFLLAAVQYLTQLPKTMTELPIDIIRVMKDVQRIIQMEEQALTEGDQELFRFYILQMSRICGENG